jgi:hypothetical protein
MQRELRPVIYESDSQIHDKHDIHVFCMRCKICAAASIERYRYFGLLS